MMGWERGGCPGGFISTRLTALSVSLNGTCFQTSPRGHTRRAELGLVPWQSTKQVFQSHREMSAKAPALPWPPSYNKGVSIRQCLLLGNCLLIQGRMSHLVSLLPTGEEVTQGTRTDLLQVCELRAAFIHRLIVDGEFCLIRPLGRKESNS